MNYYGIHNGIGDYRRNGQRVHVVRFQSREALSWWLEESRSRERVSKKEYVQELRSDRNVSVRVAAVDPTVIPSESTIILPGEGEIA